MRTLLVLTYAFITPMTSVFVESSSTIPYCEHELLVGDQSVMTSFDPATQKNIDSWLNGQYDEETKTEIRRMIQEDPQKATDAFYTSLSFGTGGLRGVVGVGTNRVNKYTVMAATQGLANYLALQPPKEGSHSVFIGYDCRHTSRQFAEDTARVLAGNNIHVYLCHELRPTPLVSFGCRARHCSAAIVITASHNPPEYNGYKVYWDDGGQIVPPQDDGIIQEVNKIVDMSMVHIADLSSPLIETVGDEIDEEYIATIRPLQNYPESNKQHGKNLKVVYTSLHGTGITMIPKTLADWGFTNCILVQEQSQPDGSFPTVKSPNPEERSALKMGMDLLSKVEGDILLATDPDADRLAVAVRHNGKVELLNGNQIACICLEHICRALIKQKRLPENAAFVKTIVTTELFRVIAEAYGRRCFDVLTGFKFIAAMIHEWEQSPDGYQYIFGGEESFGYLLGTAVRDKDAVISAALISEVALQAKLQDKTLVDLLQHLYQKYGVYREKLVSIYYGEGKTNKELMDQAMARLRANPPKTIHGTPVISIEDYQTSTHTDVRMNTTTPIDLPKSNVYRFNLSDSSKVVVRPSGTEPKIKLYCGVSRPSLSTSHERVISQCDAAADDLLESVVKILTAK